MQSCERGHVLSRQVGVEIEAMQMDQIDMSTAEHASDRAPGCRPRVFFRTVVERTIKRRNRHQRTRSNGSFRGYDDRPMARVDEGSVKTAENLFRSAYRVGSNRRERIRDAQDGKTHAAAPVR